MPNFKLIQHSDNRSARAVNFEHVSFILPRPEGSLVTFKNGSAMSTGLTPLELAELSGIALTLLPGSPEDDSPSVLVNVEAITEVVATSRTGKSCSIRMLGRSRGFTIRESATRVMERLGYAEIRPQCSNLPVRPAAPPTGPAGP